MEHRVVSLSLAPVFSAGLGLILAAVSSMPERAELPVVAVLPPAPRWESRPVETPPLTAESVPRLPAPFAAAHHGELVRGVYEVCVAPEGWVASVEPLESISPSVDVALERQIWTTWRHAPQSLSVCYAKRLTYDIP